MKQATTHVSFALSDEEDYVSFDEDDLNAGIQDLYDNNSAEECASDISNEEYFEPTSAIIQPQPAPLPSAPIPHSAAPAPLPVPLPSYLNFGAPNINPMQAPAPPPVSAPMPPPLVAPLAPSPINMLPTFNSIQPQQQQQVPMPPSISNRSSHTIPSEPRIRTYSYHSNNNSNNMQHHSHQRHHSNRNLRDRDRNRNRNNNNNNNNSNRYGYNRYNNNNNNNNRYGNNNNNNNNRRHYHNRSSSAINSRNWRNRNTNTNTNTNTNSNNNRNNRNRSSMDDLSILNNNLQKQDSIEKQKAPTKKRKPNNNNDIFESLNQIHNIQSTHPPHAPPLKPLPNKNRNSVNMYHLNNMNNMNMNNNMHPPHLRHHSNNQYSNNNNPMHPSHHSHSNNPFVPFPMNNMNNNMNNNNNSNNSPLMNKQHKLSKRIQKLNEMRAKKQKRKNRKVIHKQKINTNVISIELGTLAQSASNIATGDAIKCSNNKCNAILSKYDTLLTETDDIKLNDDDEKIWICSFCNYCNIIDIDHEEIPITDTIDYILEPPNINGNNNNNSDEKNENENDEKQIIFCIDISGSMCVTQPTDKKVVLKGDRLAKQNEELSQFIDPMDRNQFMPNQSQNVTYISRLQSVQAAVDAQIEKLKITNPNNKVGLITFNNDVTVYSNSKDKNNEIITGDKLNNLDRLKTIGKSDECKIKNKICNSYDKLTSDLWSFEEGGQTALGPALTISISMGSIKRGSKVILCTDGLANIGVGKIDGNDNDAIQQWYENLGNWAMENGIVVSIISITDDGCNLEALGKIVEMTGGNLRRINPLKLTEKFSGILDKEIIATLTNAKMLLHPGLKFVDTVTELQNLNPFENENQNVKKDDKNDKNDKDAMNVEIETETDNKNSKQENDNDNDDNKEEKEKDNNNENRKIYEIPSSQQDVGNVFDDTTIFFEYDISRNKIKQDFKELKSVPFQVHILYNKIDGTKMLRVITQMKEVTYNKKQVKDNLDYSVLSKYGTRVTTKLASVGDYEASRAFTNANARYMHNNANNTMQINSLANYVNSNIGLDYQMQQQQQVEVQRYNRNNAYNHGYSPLQNSNMNNWISRNEQISSNSNNNNNSLNVPPPSIHYQQASPQQNIQQQSSRRNNRSDKFSSNVYGMKRKF